MIKRLHTLLWLIALPLVAAGADDVKPTPKPTPTSPPVAKDGVINSDPRPETPPSPPPTPPVDPSKPRAVKLAAGELAKLTARPDDAAETDMDKYSFLWQFPDGLSSRLDSNRYEAYVTAVKAGTYKVTVVMAKNGTTRPDVTKAELLVVVGVGGGGQGGNGGGLGGKPDPTDDNNKARESYPGLIEDVKKVAGDADLKKALSSAYLTLYMKINDSTLKTDTDVDKEFNSQMIAPSLASPAAQQLIQAVVKIQLERVKDSLTLEQRKLLYLALSETLAGR